VSSARRELHRVAFNCPLALRSAAAPLAGGRREGHREPGNEIIDRDRGQGHNPQRTPRGQRG